MWRDRNDVPLAYPNYLAPLEQLTITVSCPTYTLNTRSGNKIFICNLDKQMYKKNNVLCFVEVPSKTEIARSAYCYYDNLFREERNLCLQLLWLLKHIKAPLNSVLTYTFAYLLEGAIPANLHPKRLDGTFWLPSNAPPITHTFLALAFQHLFTC